MALSPADMVKIRYYLGWSQRFHQTDSALELAMAAINQDADALVVIQDTLANGGILATLADLDVQIVAARKRRKALKIGSIELPGPMELGMLRSEGRQHVGRLATMFGVEVRHDVFSGTLPKQRATYSGMAFKGEGGGGNLPRLG